MESSCDHSSGKNKGGETLLEGAGGSDHRLGVQDPSSTAGGPSAPKREVDRERPWGRLNLWWPPGPGGSCPRKQKNVLMAGEKCKGYGKLGPKRWKSDSKKLNNRSRGRWISLCEFQASLVSCFEFQASQGCVVRSCLKISK